MGEGAEKGGKVQSTAEPLKNNFSHVRNEIFTGILDVILEFIFK